MLAILLELEEIEELLQRLTQPHATLTLDIHNDVITTQPEPGSASEVAAMPSRSSRRLTLTRTPPNGNNRAQVNRGSHADNWTR
jgi:hypothetical protein